MQNTDEEDWDELLHALTQEELRQYGQIALDQIARVDRWFWVQTVLLVVGTGLAAGGIWRSFENGFGTRTLVWVLPVAVAIYWLYRSVKARRLWWTHFSAVNGELVRRGEGEMETGSVSR